jgi:hypothetical protein
LFISGYKRNENVRKERRTKEKNMKRDKEIKTRRINEKSKVRRSLK